MTIPSGGGSEVLKIAHIAGVTNSENVILNGVANHIYSILSITICETANAAKTFDLYIDDDGGGTDYYILKDQNIGAKETFIYDNKLVLSGTDHLCIVAGSSADIDVTISYIDQDWT
jgi:kynureninase